MRWIAIVLAVGIVVGVAGCDQKPAAPTELAAVGEEIAWREGDVDDALAEVKESGKPVLLYWGAKWCPPCMQLKTTLFKDRAFIAQTQKFVPVYLDGDTQGAQKWGERFGISGYPTMIVLRADGSEITRLSTAAKLAEVLRVAAGRTTSIDALFETAETTPEALTKDEWELLAAFDWQNDPKHFGDRLRSAALLERLAGAAPKGPLQRRFALLALVVGTQKGTDGKYALSAAQQARIEEVVPAVLKTPREVVANRRELSYSIPALVAALSDAGRREKIGAALTKALDRVHGDKSLSLPDRLGTAYADIALSQAGGAAESPAVLDKVRARVAWADETAKDAMVRQSVISTAADLLHKAGDDAGARRLLEAELKRSSSPYYYMLDLASLAEDAKDGPAAIGWARQAYETSQGSATRVQWAIEYSKTVLRQAPDDKAAVEASAQAVIDELGKNSGSYYQRTRVKVGAWGGLVRDWSTEHGGGAVLARLETRMAGVCETQGEAAETCRKWGKAG